MIIINNFITKTDLKNYTKTVISLFSERDTKINENKSEIDEINLILSNMNSGLFYAGVATEIPEHPKDGELHYFDIKESNNEIVGWFFWSSIENEWKKISTDTINIDDLKTNFLCKSNGDSLDDVFRDDLNNLLEIGIYSIATSTNTPTIEKCYGNLLVFKGFYNPYLSQVFISSENKMYIRNRINQSWSDWSEIASTNSTLKTTSMKTFEYVATPYTQQLIDSVDTLFPECVGKKIISVNIRNVVGDGIVHIYCNSNRMVYCSSSSATTITYDVAYI